MRRAAETVWARVESHGRAMTTFHPVDEATAGMFRRAAGDVELAIDAGKVNTRESGWRDLKIAVISMREPGEPAAPEQWHQEDRLPEPTAVVSFARIAASRAFRRSWALVLRRLGVTALVTVHALSDGAGWIWKAVGQVLPGCTEALGIYHACERLSGCAQKMFGEGTAEATCAFERGRELLLGDGWSDVCAWVAELLTTADAAECGRRQKARACKDSCVR